MGLYMKRDNERKLKDMAALLILDPETTESIRELCLDILIDINRIEMLERVGRDNTGRELGGGACSAPTVVDCNPFKNPEGG